MKHHKKIIHKIKKVPMFGKLFIVGSLLLATGWAIEFATMLRIWRASEKCYENCSLTIDSTIKSAHITGGLGMALTMIGFSLLIAVLVLLIMTAYRSIKIAKR